jgi:hypothetical protein
MSLQDGLIPLFSCATEHVSVVLRSVLNNVTTTLCDSDRSVGIEDADIDECIWLISSIMNPDAFQSPLSDADHIFYVSWAMDLLADLTRIHSHCANFPMQLLETYFSQFHADASKSKLSMSVCKVVVQRCLTLQLLVPWQKLCDSNLAMNAVRSLLSFNVSDNVVLLANMLSEIPMRVCDSLPADLIDQFISSYVIVLKSSSDVFQHAEIVVQSIQSCFRQTGRPHPVLLKMSMHLINDLAHPVFFSCLASGLIPLSAEQALVVLRSCCSFSWFGNLVSCFRCFLDRILFMDPTFFMQYVWQVVKASDACVDASISMRLLDTSFCLWDCAELDANGVFCIVQDLPFAMVVDLALDWTSHHAVLQHRLSAPYSLVLADVRSKMSQTGTSAHEALLSRMNCCFDCNPVPFFELLEQLCKDRPQDDVGKVLWVAWKKRIMGSQQLLASSEYTLESLGRPLVSVENILVSSLSEGSMYSSMLRLLCVHLGADARVTAAVLHMMIALVWLSLRQEEFDILRSAVLSACSSIEGLPQVVTMDTLVALRELLPALHEKLAHVLTNKVV